MSISWDIWDTRDSHSTMPWYSISSPIYMTEDGTWRLAVCAGGSWRMLNKNCVQTHKMHVCINTPLKTQIAKRHVAVTGVCVTMYLPLASKRAAKEREACNVNKKLGRDLRVWVWPPDGADGHTGWQQTIKNLRIQTSCRCERPLGGTRRVKYNKSREERMKIPKKTLELFCWKVSYWEAGYWLNK